MQDVVKGNQVKKLMLLALGAFLLSGCSWRVADLTAASTKNYNINGGKFVTGPRVKATDSVPVVLFPLGYPSVKEAIDQAIEKDKCAVGLTNVVVDAHLYAFIFGVEEWEVEGDLVGDRNLPGCENIHY